MGNSPKQPKQKINRTIHSAQSLQLQKDSLPHSIVEVVSTLHKAGFEAYIVGGGVRDSLLGLAPKDFDAVTDARPHEIKAIFGGRCRIIGRRFQLAHVYSGREMIEVATFRAPPKDDTHTTEEGMLMRDNVWGNIEQDFARRDFSINALYYQPIKGEVLDFCAALDDIANRRLRLLGDAAVRIEEDPVRLLRALRFKAKLGFDFDKSLASQFHADNWGRLEQVSAHRLYDETQKMFGGGYLAPLLPLLFEHGAMTSLMRFAPNAPTPLMMAIAKNTDQRVAAGKSVNPAFFYAALLWENYLHQLAKFKKRGLQFFDAQKKAAEQVFDAQRSKTAIPKFAEQFIAEIWFLQPKLVNPRVREIANIERLPRFRAAFDFLVMRENHDNHPLSEPTLGMASWWQAYQDASSADKQAMIEAFDQKALAPKRRRRERGKDSMNAELAQLRELSLRSEVVKTRPEPLFVVAGADKLLQNHEQAPPKPKRPIIPEMPVPVFAKVCFSEADFEKLLANDEPYIPAARHRKRKPSSTLSIKERNLGISEADLAAQKAQQYADDGGTGQHHHHQKQRSSRSKKTDGANKNKQRTRSRKSNAKPKADV